MPHLSQADGKCQTPRKIEPVPGCLTRTLQRCGKRNCRCARGQLHGPYWSRFWCEHGRRRRQYVRPSDVDDVRVAIEAWRCLHPPVRSTRTSLGEVRRLLRDLEA
jgi:hypothetical protein